MPNKKKSIGLEVDEKIYKMAKHLADKEGWSLRQLAGKAMEYYLKLRGYK